MGMRIDLRACKRDRNLATGDRMFRPDDLLHGKLRCDPGTSATFISGTVVQNKLKTETTTLGGGVTQHLPPWFGVRDDLRSRAVQNDASPRCEGVGQTIDGCTTDAGLFHCFEIKGYALPCDVRSHPHPEDIGPR